jgi:Domain of unknown function (DUF932)
MGCSSQGVHSRPSAWRIAVNVVEDVVAHALGMSERFEALAAQVERIEERRLINDEQIRFAERALTLRYPEQAAMAASQLLNCRRPEDTGDDLHSALNRVQENLLRGGLSPSLEQRPTDADAADRLDRGGLANQQGPVGCGGRDGRGLSANGRGRQRWRSLHFYLAAATIGDDCLDGHAMRGPPNGRLGFGVGSVIPFSLLLLLGPMRFAAF